MKRAGWNPTKRNRNIGTAKQGYGRDNELSIPQPADTLKTFYERFDSAESLSIVVHKRELPVIVESLKKDCCYSCTPADIEHILNQLPVEDLEDFGIVIFRQPKKKESILSSVWGRLIYSLEYKDDHYPAIIIEATPCNVRLKYPKKQTVEDKLEFSLLMEDGVNFKEDKRDFIADLEREDIRRIQLYRTLLHEVGHYVHYLEVVERPGYEDEDFDSWKIRNDNYFSIPAREKEAYANRYATSQKELLFNKGILPFERIESKQINVSG